jgi:hypothetical protein
MAIGKAEELLKRSLTRGLEKGKARKEPERQERMESRFTVGGAKGGWEHRDQM